MTPIPANFFDFHNTPKKLNDRQLMLEGKWPTGGCEYCKNIEDAGGTSDRLFQLQIPNLAPPELDTDITATSVTPRIVEVYFDNLCNMSCIYCIDKFSSRIEQENIRFGNFKHGNLEIKNRFPKTDNFEKLSADFWEWMNKNYQTIRRFHILGGEPFFQPQFETCLEFLETNQNSDLEFNIISNLKVAPNKFKKYINRIKHLVETGRIGRFDLTCSIDCWGDEHEYIRYGSNLGEWQENFDYVANEKWITLNINQTITGLGMKSMPDLIHYINGHRSADREIGHYFAACTNRRYLYPGTFGKGFFDKDFEKILSAMPNETWQQKHARSLMEGLQLEFNTNDRNLEELNNLKAFLTEMDRRRGCDWQKTFPWLIKELENVV
jgi:hypothetical protein